MKHIKRYLWFIWKSQDFMEGYNPVWVFFRSLYLGIGFCKRMSQDDKMYKHS
ncbi:hypothetical protein [Levilactobacillus brevis]|uniref:hypothetical protein n=1 Tax=Levilactobacillus brevis TaxID=1580 RepID=UPI0021A47723|nr:hypothetical protein [Levilactobacillus brevis]